MASTIDSPSGSTSANQPAKQSSDNTSHILPLPFNRQMHYAATGDPTSNTLIIFFSGYLSIGTVSDPIPAPLLNLPNNGGSAYYVAPTIPGNGASSPTAAGSTYHASLIRDLNALLNSLYPAGPRAAEPEQIYVGGGSYGTIAAQMVYGADEAVFPWARKLKGLLLMAPFSPFRLHREYTAEMTWANWVGMGPVARRVPFRIVPRLVSCVMAGMLRDEQKAEKFMRDFVFGTMGAEERSMCERWLADRGKSEDQWIKEMARGPRSCVSESEGGWKGFLEGPEVAHSDWGFDPRELGGERGKVLIAAGDEDELGMGMCQWLRDSYHGAKLKIVKGGHIAGLWHIDEIWAELMSTTNNE